MASGARVCPFCGERPGAGVFCESCGRNLSGVERLPTRAEWETGAPAGAADSRALHERCAEATTAFVAAMHAAGDPGAGKLPLSGKSGPFRTPHLQAWVVRPVQHDPDDHLKHEPGLVLTTEGRFHRLDSEVRGWGQRDFPRFHDSVDPEPIEPPVDERLIDELAALLDANGVSAA